MGLFTKVRRHEGKVGGLFYFVSVFSLLILALLTSTFLLLRIFDIATTRQFSLILYGGLLVVGLLIGVIIRGKLSVFIHELKHSIVSSLAGNKAKGMKIEDESGHFEYSFSKSTSHLNACISLAPYTFPLFFLFSLLVAALIYTRDQVIAHGIVVVALGADLALNAKDVSPYQTDFSEVRGGFRIGLIYVLCFNVLVLSLVSLVVIFGFDSLLDLGKWLFELALRYTQK